MDLALALRHRLQKLLRDDASFFDQDKRAQLVANVEGAEVHTSGQISSPTKLSQPDSRCVECYRIVFPENAFPNNSQMSAFPAQRNSNSIPIRDALLGKLESTFGQTARGLTKSLLYLSVAFTQQFQPGFQNFFIENRSTVLPNPSYSVQKFDNSKITFSEFMQKIEAQLEDIQNQENLGVTSNENSFLEIRPDSLCLTSSMSTSNSETFLQNLVQFVWNICESPCIQLQEAFFRAKIELTPNQNLEWVDNSESNLNETELAIAQVWSELLSIPVETVKNSDDFLSLGGSSLKISDVLQNVEKLPIFKPLKVYSIFFDRVSLSQAAVLLAAKRDRFDQYKFLVKRPNPGLCPLSYQQEQIWLHLQAPQTPPTLFNESGRMRFDMDLDFNTFESAFKLLVQRNSILTLTIHTVNGKVFQKMDYDQEPPISFVDLSHLIDEKERNNATRAIVFAEAQKPMNFETGPLHRHVLIRLGSNLSELVSVSHHLLTDGAGYLIFEAELRQLIKFCAAGSLQPLPPPGLQFTDFALWQRETFENGRNVDLSNFWKAKLEGLTPLNIPTDISRLSDKNRQTCNRFMFQLRPEVAALVKASVEAPQKTTFLILTTALNILLARYSGQTDISVLTAKHGRNHRTLAGMIGHFVNLLVIRNEVDEHLSFSQFLTCVQKCLQKAYEHDDYPFQHAFNNLGLQLEERPDFFKIAVSMVPRQREVKGKGLSSDYLNVRNKHAKYDLLLFFDDREDIIACCIEYNSDLYSKSRIERMSQHFQNILQQGLTKPNEAIRHINMLSSVEVQTISNFSNAGQTTESDSSTLISLFETQVEQSPENIAISQPENSSCKELSYKKLNEAAEKLSGVLMEQLSSTDQVVAIVLPNGINFMISSLGVLKSGRTCLPLGTENPKQRMEFMLQDFHNPIVISRRKTLKKLGMIHSRTLFIEDLDFNSRKNSTIEKPLKPTPHDIAYAFFTSGTTGKSKAVLLEHSSLLKFVDWTKSYFNMTGSDRSLLFTNPAFDVSIAEIWPCLTSGGTLVCPPADLRFNVPELRTWVKRQGVTILNMTTVLAEAFYKADTDQFSESLRWVACGGEKLSVLPKPDVPFRLAHCYGVTEASVTNTVFTLPRETASLQQIPIGKPLPYVRIYILNADMQLCPVGIYGELYIGGDALCRSYHERDDLNSVKFVNWSGERLYKTGDIGRWMEDGNIGLLGRSDNQIKIRGYRIELDEIEVVLKTVPFVEGAVVVQDKQEQQIHTFITLKNTSNLSEFNSNDLRTFAASQLPHWAVPSSFTAVARFPVTTNGKVDRVRILSEFKASQQALRRKELAGRSRTFRPLEQAIANIWSFLLKVPETEIHLKSNFFELGGNSLLIGEFIGKLQEKYLEFTKLSVGTVFSNPTIESFAVALEKQSAPSTKPKKFADYLEHDLELNIQPVMPNSDESSRSAKTILLTGVTGYLGSQLLYDLLQLKNTAKVYCIVRAGNDTIAHERVKDTLETYKLDVSPHDLSNRVKCLAGDLSKFRFGLEPSEYLQLAGTVNLVYHSASEVHFMKSYGDLRGHNVQGTKEIIQFVAQGRSKVLHFVSTLGVMELDQVSSHEEIGLTNINEVAHSNIGYLQTKWVAEKLIWKAIEKGVRAIIYRPGLVGCSSDRNVVNETDTLGRLLKYCDELGSYPDVDWISPYSTVDFTSQAIIELSQGSGTGKVYHVFQNSISLKEMIKLNSSGMKRLSLEAWLELSETSGINPVSRMLFKALADRVSSDKPLLEFSQGSQVSFSNWNTVKALDESKFSFELSREDVQRYLDLLLRKH